MAVKGRIAWTNIKSEYIATDVTYRELAKKHGVSLRAIAGKAKEENWQKEKQDYCNNVATKVQQKTSEKTAESFANYTVELRGDIIQINRDIITKIYQTLHKYDLAFSPKDLKNLSSMLTDLMNNHDKMLAHVTQKAEGLTVRFVGGEWLDGTGTAETERETDPVSE